MSPVASRIGVASARPFLGKLGFLGLHDKRRKLRNAFWLAVISFGALIALLPLISISLYVVQKGAAALNPDFFLKLPLPISQSGGGMAHAMLGSAVLVVLAAVIGVPIGIASGIFLSEYHTSRLAKWLRFSADMLTNVPSIIIGLFVYALLVMPMHGFSAYAGGCALAIIMIPVVARTTEEILKLVPDSIRESGLALGLPRWKVILMIVLKGSRNGIVTGLMLAIARAAGETAPLLFTAFGSKYWPNSLSEPIASLPVQIYTYAISPYEDWHAKAWAGALVLVVFVFVINILIRLLVRGRVQRA